MDTRDLSKWDAVAEIHALEEVARSMLQALKAARVYLGDEYTDDSDEARATRETIDSALCAAEVSGIRGTGE